MTAAVPDELRGRLTVTVPEAGRLLGLGRKAAYAAAQRGEIPTLKFGGRRVVVPVPKLLELVGHQPDMQAAPPLTGDAAANILDLDAQESYPHGDTARRA